MAETTGFRFIAEMLRGYGIGAVFHVPYILDGALVELEKLGVRRIRCHSEKAAAYMADGYARAARGPGIAMAQSVGAANLAAGLQDAWLACSPVIALTGRWMPHYLYRQAYQEIDHRPLYDPVTKFNAYVDGVEQVPLLLRQAFREATTGAPRPVHLDFMGLAGDLAAGSKFDAEVTVEPYFRRYPAFRPEPEPARIAEAARRIARAGRPVLVAGGRGSGVRRAGRGGPPGGEALSPGGDLAERQGRDPREPSPVGGGRGFLFAQMRQRDRVGGRPGDLRRQPHRRPGHPFLADPQAGHAGRPDRRGPLPDRPQLSRRSRHPGRREGDAGAPGRGRRSRAGKTGVDGQGTVARGCLAGRIRRAARLRRRADTSRAPLPGNHRFPAAGRHPRIGHGPRRHVDGRHDRDHGPGTDLPPLRRVPGLGLSRGHGRQVRGAGPSCHLLHRRRRILVPPRENSRRPPGSGSTPSR